MLRTRTIARAQQKVAKRNPLIENIRTKIRSKIETRKLKRLYNKIDEIIFPLEFRMEIKSALYQELLEKNKVTIEEFNLEGKYKEIVKKLLNEGPYELIKLFIEEGMAIEKKYKKLNRNILHCVAHNKDKRVVDYIIEKLWERSLLSTYKREEDRYGKRPHMIATRLRNKEIANRLV